MAPHPLGDGLQDQTCPIASAPRRAIAPGALGFRLRLILVPRSQDYANREMLDYDPPFKRQPTLVHAPNPRNWRCNAEQSQRFL